MNIVTAFPGDVAHWVSKRIPGVELADFGDYRAIGFIHDNELLAGAVYSNYRPEYGDIELTLATAGNVRAVRQGIEIGLTYPFEQLGCQRVTVRCRASNARARKLAEGTGFVLEGVKRRGYGDEDMCIYGLLREEAERWFHERT